MTISSTTFRTAWVAANGVNKNWSYNFALFSQGQATIQVRDNTTGEITDFSDNLSLFKTDDESGYVQYPVTGAAVVAGYSVRVVRQLPYTQEVAIGNEGSFDAELHETAFDTLTILTQQLADQTSRAIQTLDGNIGGVFVQDIPEGIVLVSDGENGIKSSGVSTVDITSSAAEAINAAAAALVSETNANTSEVSALVYKNAAAASATEAEGYITGALTDDIIGAATDKAATPFGVLNYVKRRAALTPEDFGAIAVTDWDSPHDSTAALLALAAAVNSDPLPIYLRGLYAKDDVLDFTNDKLVIFGDGAGRSGLVSLDCDGFTLTQAARFSSFRFEDFANLTDRDSGHTGFAFTGAHATDPITMRGAKRLLSGGLARTIPFDTGSNGWLNDFNLTEADGAHFEDIQIWSRASDPGNGYPVETIGFNAIDTTGLVLSNCWATYTKTGVKMRGQSESMKILQGGWVAVDVGIDVAVATEDGPSNAHEIVGTHVAANRTAMKLGTLGTSKGAGHNVVSNCFLIGRADYGAVDGFTFIELDCIATQVINNQTFSGVDPDANHHTFVKALSGANHLVAHNILTSPRVVVDIAAGVTDIMVAFNGIRDLSYSSGAAPYVNAASGGEANFVGNYGDRADKWPANFTMNAPDNLYTFWGRSGVQFKVGLTAARIGFSVTNGGSSTVNYLDAVPNVAASSPYIRALGDDTDIDLRVQPKGAGLFRSQGNFVPHSSDGFSLGTSSLAWSDGFFASGAVLNFAAGNYTITHSTGKLTFNGAVLTTGVGGVGYATGAGGTVTQATSKSTGVTLNKPSGQITMNAAALAIATAVSFTLTNSAIAAGDVLILNHISGGTIAGYTINAQCAAGSATITIRNNTAGILSEAVVIAFALVKAVTS